jgi:hypothetical protein
MQLRTPARFIPPPLAATYKRAVTNIMLNYVRKDKLPSMLGNGYAPTLMSPEVNRLSNNIIREKYLKYMQHKINFMVY